LKQQEIAALYKQWGPVVYRRCLRLLKNREEAQDATQQVFIQLLRHRSRFAEQPEQAIPWVQAVATNVSLNRLRDGNRRSSKLDAVHEEHATPVAPDQVLSDQQLAKKLLARADTPARELAVAVLLGERTHEDVAASLGVSEKTVQRRLHRFLSDARKSFLGKDEP
jgi:RNA polymerase sigma-70 factor (ECF subfamily)